MSDDHIPGTPPALEESHPDMASEDGNLFRFSSETGLWECVSGPYMGQPGYNHVSLIYKEHGEAWVVE